MNNFTRFASEFSIVNSPDQLNQKKLVYTLTKPKMKKPSMYKVIILNDDFTPMDFVIYVLKTIFNKPIKIAISIMLKIHNSGTGICGLFTYEIAEEKAHQVTNLAKKHQYPLQCIFKKD